MVTVPRRRLEELHLDFNKLATLDLALTELRSLRRLSLTHNRIQQVPAEIRRLQDLVELNLDHNRIGPSLPRNMSRLASSLQILGVSYNFLAEFPPCLHELDLVVLRLEGNRATDYVVVSNSDSGLITHGASIPRRECDGFLQTHTSGGKLLPGYVRRPGLAPTKCKLSAFLSWVSVMGGFLICVRVVVAPFVSPFGCPHEDT